MKKSLSILLVVLMTLSMFTVCAYAQDETIIDRGSCGYATSYILREDGSLTITADYVSDKTMVGHFAFSSKYYPYSDLIKTVEIGDGIATIGEDAFFNCKNLESVKVGPDVKEIIYGAFARCYNLEEVILQEGVETINAPFNCSMKIKEINLPASVKEFNLTFSGIEVINVDENNPYYKSIDGVLYSKDGTTLIRYPEMKPDKVYTVAPGTTKIAISAFMYCAIAEEIILPETIEEIGDEAFILMSSLKKINIPESVTKIGEAAFGNCSALKEISIPSSVSEIERSSFAACTSLENVNLSDGLEKIDEGAFELCVSLQNITIPETVTAIEKDAFHNASVINTTVLPQDVQMENSGFGTVAVNTENIENVVNIYSGIMSLIQDGNHGYIDFETYEEELNLLEEEMKVYCNLSDDGTMIPLDNQPTVIIGHQGSTAQAYAQANDLRFTSCPLGEHTNIQNNTDSYPATCTEPGSSGYSVCLDCNTVTAEAQIIPATGHTDNNNDDICDNCGDELHSHEEAPQTFIERIKAFFDRILDFFRNLFR